MKKFKVTPLSSPRKRGESPVAMMMVLLIVALLIPLCVQGQDGVPVAKHLRFREVGQMHNETLQGLADTTATAYIRTHYISDWPVGGFGVMAWVDSISGYNLPDSTIYEARYKYVYGGGWTTWTKIFQITTRDTSYTKLTWPSSWKPYAFQTRARTEADTLIDRCVPHDEVWGW